MSLTELIDRHSDSIPYSQLVRTPEGGRGYQRFSRRFGGELLRLPSFNYAKEDMKLTGSHLCLDLVKPKSYEAVWPVVANVISYAIRRAGLEILPITARRKIWNLMELAYLRDFDENSKQKFNDAVHDYISVVGKDRAEKYLTQVLGRLEMVRAEVDALKSDEADLLNQRRIDYRAALILNGAAAGIPSEEPPQPLLNTLIHDTSLRHNEGLIKAILKWVKTS